MVCCEKHNGTRGEPRRFIGGTHRKYFRYDCQVPGCAHRYLMGKELEDEAKEHLKELFFLNAERPGFLGNNENLVKTRLSLEIEMTAVKKEYESKITALSRLENEHVLNEIMEEVYHQTKNRLESRCQWIKDRITEIYIEMNKLAESDQASKVLSDLWEDYEDRINSLTDAEWRHLFETLNLEVHVYENDLVKGEYTYKSIVRDDGRRACHTCGHNIPEEYSLLTKFPFCEFRFGINLGLNA
jgi:hypothetical protein